MKFGVDQFNKPTPKAYEKFLTFLISVVVPATATLIVSLPVATDEVKMYVGLIVTWLLAILNGLKYFLGDDSVHNKGTSDEV